MVNGPAHKNLLSGAFEEHRLRGSRETRRCSFRGVYILQTRRLILFRRCVTRRHASSLLVNYRGERASFVCPNNSAHHVVNCPPLEDSFAQSVARTAPVLVSAPPGSAPPTSPCPSGPRCTP